MSIPRHDATGGGRRRRRGAGFTPLNLFAASEVGLWYDPSDLTPEKLAWVAANPGFTSAQFLAAFPTHSLFQTAAGEPVTALGQSVGFVLDRRLGPSGVGAQVITNGTFGADTDWTKGTGWAIGSGVATKTAGTASLLSQAVTVTAGTSYILRYVLTRSAGSITPQLSGGSTVSGTARSAAGTYIEILTAVTGNTTFEFSADASFAGTVDNVTLLAIPAGNHAWQATSTARPTLQARANLLTYSEQFDNAAWTKRATAPGTTVSANSTTAPDGTSTADTIGATSTTTGDFVQVNTASTITKPAASATYTFSAYVKQKDLRYCSGGVDDNANNGYFFRLDLADGSVYVNPTSYGSGFSNPSVTVQSVGSGWYRFAFTVTTNTATVIRPAIGFSKLSDASSTSYTAGEGSYAWGADLRLGTSAGTYQRVTTATDYADVGLPRSLTFDGTDDSLVTPSVNFTATDKMTVCAGVFKQSDVGTRMIVELSAIVDSNDGTFALLAPSTSGTNSYRFVSKGTSISNAGTGQFAVAPDTAVLTGLGDIAGDIATLRRNGALVQTATTDQGTGNFGNYPLFIGSRNQASNPLNGRIHQLIVRGAATDTATIQQTERFVAQKTGVTL